MNSPAPSNLQPQSRSDQSGSSLLETSLALALSLLLLAFAWDAGASWVRHFKTLDRKVEIQQQGRIGLEMLAGEIQSAGMGMHASYPVFLSATENAVTFKANPDRTQTRLASDVFPGTLTLPVSNGSGFRSGKEILICILNRCEASRLGANGETEHLHLEGPLLNPFPGGSRVTGIRTVTYRLNRNGQLLRKVDQGGPNEVANGIEDLAFRYFDRNGRVTRNPDAIRRVHIRLTAGDEAEGRRTFSSSVWVRNR